MKKRSSSRDAYFTLRVLTGFTLGSLGLCLGALALSVYSNPPAQAASNGSVFTTIHPDYADISKPIREYPGWPTIDRSGTETEGPENPKILLPHQDKDDAVVQRKSVLGMLA